MRCQRRRTTRRRAAAGRNQTAAPGDLGRAEQLLGGLGAMAIKVWLGDCRLMRVPCPVVSRWVKFMSFPVTCSKWLSLYYLPISKVFDMLIFSRP